MTAVDVWEALDRRLDPSEVRPQLADDVEVARFPLRDGTADVVAHNPRGAVYYRLSEAEADLLASFDGSHTVAELVAGDLVETGALDAAAVVDLVRLLHRGGFLAEPYIDTGAAVERALGRADAGWRGKALTAIRTFDVQWTGADRFLRALYDRGGRHLFSPAGKTLTVLVGVGGFAAFVATTAANDFAVAGDELGLAVLSLFLLDMVSVFVHETGHAFLLIRHGRRVNGAGVRLYFGTPAFYIESTDALLLDQRRRLWQSFAGPWAEFVAGSAVALIVAAFPQSPVADLLWRFCIVCYFTVFLNLMPLLELDGYWILSDWLRVRDLRARSLAFVRRDLWWKVRQRRALTRSEVGLALYGTAGVAFTVLVSVSAIAYWNDIGGGLVRRLWEAGPLGVAGLVLLVVAIGGPLIAAFATAAQSLVGRGRRLARRVRFRYEKRWRVEAALLLDQQPVFDDVPVETLNQLAGVVGLRQVSAGEAVIRQGDRGDAYYLVRRGTFEVVDEGGDREEVLRVVGPGESFGEMALVDNAPRNATVRAVEPGQLYVISRSAFDRLLADRAEVRTIAATLQQLDELRALQPFAHLGPAELADLAARGRWCAVTPGADVVTQGDEGDAFYVVQSGRFEVLEDGEVVRTIEPGEHFGEIALLHDVTRVATVRALSPARVFRLDRTGFDRLVRRAFAAGQVRPNLELEHI